jgi:uncharacterized protein (TIGR02217 family)
MSYQDFDEVRFEDGIITRGTSGGPSFNTTVVTTQSGKEYRQKNWQFSRGSWNLGNRTLLPNELKQIQEFFQARGGRARGFRFKDFADYKDETRGKCGNMGTNNILSAVKDGSGFYKLFKVYNSGGSLYYRRVSKPVLPTIKIFSNQIQANIGTGTGDYTINYQTGTIHFTPMFSVSISSISKAANGIVTALNHGLSSGNKVAIQCSGMDEVDQRSFFVTYIDANNFYINENTSDYNDFTGGVMEIHENSGDLITWTGEFDTPVRFDTDKLDLYFEERIKYTNRTEEENYYQLNSLPIVEIKVD